VKSPKFPDVFTLAPPSLFKSGRAVIAPLSGLTVKSTHCSRFVGIFYTEQNKSNFLESFGGITKSKKL
jgi:hypothetical protein